MWNYHRLLSSTVYHYNCFTFPSRPSDYRAEVQSLCWGYKSEFYSRAGLCLSMSLLCFEIFSAYPILRCYLLHRWRFIKRPLHRTYKSDEYWIKGIYTYIDFFLNLPICLINIKCSFFTIKSYWKALIKKAHIKFLQQKVNDIKQRKIKYLQLLGHLNKNVKWSIWWNYSRMSSTFLALAYTNIINEVCYNLYLLH